MERVTYIVVYIWLPEKWTYAGGGVRSEQNLFIFSHGLKVKNI